MIEKIYELYATHYLVDTDTRNIRKNSIFFALKGDNFNGNKYAEEALQKGARYCIIDEEAYDTSDSFILVNNVLETLQKLANYHRKQLNISIISLTGSNGKTTTKELINTVLSEKYRTTATIGNLNNHIGVPLTLLSMTPQTEIGIVEMGANHLNEIAFLCNIAMPDFGYITNFGKAHLEGFGSEEGVIKGKSELYDYLKANNKTAFVNPKDTIQVEKTKNLIQLFFEESISFDSTNPFVKINYQDIQIQSNLIGNYNFNNIAAAISIGQYFDLDKNTIKDAIEKYVPSNNRSQIIKTQTNRIILDAYNANPSSMKAAIENMKTNNSTNKVLILGDMFELGDASLDEHQAVAKSVTSEDFQQIYLVGEHFCKTTTENIKFKNFEELKDYLLKNPLTNSTILIKGSRGMALERCLDYIN